MSVLKCCGLRITLLPLERSLHGKSSIQVGNEFWRKSRVRKLVLVVVPHFLSRMTDTQTFVSSLKWGENLAHKNVKVKFI